VERNTNSPAEATPLQAILPVDNRWRRQLLTIGLEDYFQVGAFNRLIQKRQWYRFESRLEKNTWKTLDLLDDYKIKATFFVLGWIADQYPDLVREVAERGHEIASKGYYHRSIRQMTPGEFEDDALVSRQALEEASQTRVHGYRVAHEWFTEQDLWALDALARAGYSYDSSLAPRGRQFRGEDWRRFPHQHAHADRTLWEFPITTTKFAGLKVPISGGNYFRQLPQWFIRRRVADAVAHNSVPTVFYFHVWEIDPDQPKITAGSMLERIRHYRNLDRMEAILRSYLEQYKFTTIADYLKLKTELKREPGDLKPPSEPFLRLKRRTSTEFELKIPEELLKFKRRTPATIVVPLYNEELVLPYLANTLSSVHQHLMVEYDLEFILVDDGSKDGTWEEMRRLFGSEPKFQLIRHAKNSGVAAAIMTGIRAAQNDIVGSIDCDCTYDPHELEKMFPLLTDGVDMVTASPYHPKGGVLNVPGWRLWLSKRASAMYRQVLRQNLYTYTSCFRVYRKSKVAHLTIRRGGYLGIAEMLGLVDLSGGKIVEHPATLEVRMLGRSKMKMARTILGHLRLMAGLLRRRLTGNVPPPPPTAIPADHPQAKVLNRLRELNIEPVVERLKTGSNF
jgi:polysaccharide deacetylase family protein (PEP-CTERM system associated)